MYVIQQKDVIQILENYQLDSNLKGFDILVHYQELDTECLVILARLYGRTKYVLKLLNCKSVSVVRENQQSKFSEFLRDNNIAVPQKYKSGNRFCIIKNISGVDFYITVEDYYGKDVLLPNIDVTGFLGKTLAKLHALSYQVGYSIGKGSTYRVITNCSAKFERIWTGTPEKYLDKTYLNLISQMHSSKLQELCQYWTMLPIATVHADLGLSSNLVLNQNGYGIIDFNLAGDETLLGDLLMTWYGSRYKFEFIMNTSEDETSIFMKEYFNNYFSVRKLKKVEIENFEKTAKFMNGVYFSKYVAELFQRGYDQYAIQLVKYIPKHYEQLDTDLPLHRGVCENGRP